MYYCLGKFAVVTDILLLPLDMCSISVLKLYRVTKSSLSPEVVALSNGIDIGIFIRVLAIELLTGILTRYLIDTRNSYSVISPFGLSPCEEDTMEELNIPADSSGKQEKNDDHPKIEIREQTLRDKLFQFDQEHVEMMKLLVLADSANAYSSLASGFPNPTEKTIKVLLSYIRNWMNLLALSFVDKDYNLADCGTKKDTVANRLLRVVAQTNIFKIGFMGGSGSKINVKSRRKVAPV